MFFGLNGAKEEIKQKQDAIIVEGEFDAISLFMEGIKNVVAIKGTALTENQVNLLARFTPKVTLCLDQDNAGIEATRRSLEVIEKKGLVAAMIVVGDAKDPDEAIKKNPLMFKKAVKESVGVYDYFIGKFVKDNNKATADGKRVITDNLLPLFANISNEVIKEHYLKKLSSVLDISFESLIKEVEKLQKKDLEDKIIIPRKDKRTRREVLEEYLFALIIQNENPKRVIEENETILSEYKFEMPSLQKLLEGLISSLSKKEKFDIKEFSKGLSKEFVQTFDTCYLFPLPKFSDEKTYEEEVGKVSKELLTIYVKENVRMISEEIKTKEVEKKAEEVEALKEKFTRLLALLPKS
jgi:DNA primase